MDDMTRCELLKTISEYQFVAVELNTPGTPLPAAITCTTPPGSRSSLPPMRSSTARL